MSEYQNLTQKNKEREEQQKRDLEQFKKTYKKSKLKKSLIAAIIAAGVVSTVTFGTGVGDYVRTYFDDETTDIRKEVITDKNYRNYSQDFKNAIGENEMLLGEASAIPYKYFEDTFQLTKDNILHDKSYPIRLQKLAMSKDSVYMFTSLTSEKVKIDYGIEDYYRNPFNRAELNTLLKYNVGEDIVNDLKRAYGSVDFNLMVQKISEQFTPEVLSQAFYQANYENMYGEYNKTIISYGGIDDNDKLIFYGLVESNGKYSIFKLTTSYEDRIFRQNLYSKEYNYYNKIGIPVISPLIVDKENAVIEKVEDINNVVEPYQKNLINEFSN